MAENDVNKTSYEKAQSKVVSSGSNVTANTFNKAWDRVYGKKEYKPSWVATGGSRLPPPKPLNRPLPKKKEPEAQKKNLSQIEEESKRRQRSKSSDEEPPFKPGVHKTKATRKDEVLTINGKELPKEPELDVWKQQIETSEVDKDGRPVYNKIVKQSDIPGWMKGNSYWEASSDTPSKPIKPVKLPEKKRAPCKVYTAKYDLTVFENKVKRDDLKIGDSEVPEEKELQDWSEHIEIPETVDESFDVEPDDSELSEKRKNWNKVLHTADVPGFFSNNNYWA
ncbi:uncharacterized protein LOC144353380 [Saccoglossus kowalevskii]